MLEGQTLQRSGAFRLQVGGGVMVQVIPGEGTGMASLTTDRSHLQAALDEGLHQWGASSLVEHDAVEHAALGELAARDLLGLDIPLDVDLAGRGGGGQAEPCWWERGAVVEVGARSGGRWEAGAAGSAHATFRRRLALTSFFPSAPSFTTFLTAVSARSTIWSPKRELNFVPMVDRTMSVICFVSSRSTGTAIWQCGEGGGGAWWSGRCQAAASTRDTGGRNAEVAAFGRPTSHVPRSAPACTPRGLPAAPCCSPKQSRSGGCCA